MKNNYEILIVDDCSTCSEKVLPILEKLFTKFLLKQKNLEEPFKKPKIYAVIHFAGKKAVGESVEKSLLFYENNFAGTFNLIEL